MSELSQINEKIDHALKYFPFLETTVRNLDAKVVDLESNIKCNNIKAFGVGEQSAENEHSLVQDVVEDLMQTNQQLKCPALTDRPGRVGPQKARVRLS